MRVMRCGMCGLGRWCGQVEPVDDRRDIGVDGLIVGPEGLGRLASFAEGNQLTVARAEVVQATSGSAGPSPAGRSAAASGTTSFNTPPRIVGCGSTSVTVPMVLPSLMQLPQCVTPSGLVAGGTPSVAADFSRTMAGCLPVETAKTPRLLRVFPRLHKAARLSVFFQSWAWPWQLQ